VQQLPASLPAGRCRSEPPLEFRAIARNVTDGRYYYLIHNRDSIFSAELDASVGSFGLRVQKTPVVRKY